MRSGADRTCLLSPLSRTGIDDLLETILLQADVSRLRPTQTPCVAGNVLEAKAAVRVAALLPLFYLRYTPSAATLAGNGMAFGRVVS